MTDAPLRLTLRRRFPAPPDLVFAAWTDPDGPVGWWGPRGFDLVSHASDPRPGGRWRLAMRSSVGAVMVSSGTYREIEPPTRLVMTHAWEDQDGRPGPDTLVAVTLTPLADGSTDMLFEQTGFDSVASRDGHEGGWTEAFASLAGALGGGAGKDGMAVVAVDGGVAAVVRRQAAFADLPGVQRQARQALEAALGRRDPPLRRLTVWRLGPPGTLDYAPGVLLPASLPVAEPVSLMDLPGGRAARLVLRGPYDGLPAAWGRLFDAAAAEKLQLTGLNWEVYAADGEPDGAELFALLA